MSYRVGDIEFTYESDLVNYSSHDFDFNKSVKLKMYDQIFTDLVEFTDFKCKTCGAMLYSILNANSILEYFITNSDGDKMYLTCKEYLMEQIIE